jgi:hypothetical protein
MVERGDDLISTSIDGMTVLEDGAKTLPPREMS